MVQTPHVSRGSTTALAARERGFPVVGEVELQNLKTPGGIAEPTPVPQNKQEFCFGNVLLMVLVGRVMPETSQKTGQPKHLFLTLG